MSRLRFSRVAVVSVVSCGVCRLHASGRASLSFPTLGDPHSRDEKVSRDRL